MESIQIISTSIVCVASDHKEPNLRIHLTTWDLELLLQDGIQKGLVFHKPKPDHDPHHENLIHHLQTSLSRTLDFFLPLAGRLATIENVDETMSFFIDCNNAGAEFVHAVADGVSVSDVIEQAYVPDLIVNSFFPLNGIRNYEGTSKPLLGVQVTELVDGIFIGCSINHAVLDGTSFWHFFNSWSEISRGFDSLSKPPILQRWFLRDTDYPIPIPLFKNEQLHSKVVPPPPLQQRVFHFTAESIAKLKANANASIGAEKISSLQALLSHLWRSAVRSKRLDPDQETSFRIIIGVRSRLQPPLPQQYLGNAIQGADITMKAREVLEQGLGYVALQMNKTVAMHTEEKLRHYLESWRENPKFAIETHDSLPSNCFLTSSSPRYNVYGNDFGWGRPIAVRSGPANKFDGKMTIFPGSEEGSVDIEACLSPETLQGLGNDAEFIDVFTDL
ncbi:hypothetical protein LWI29_009908 [Acer saccharum]|uniref:HXXXD-type acyl-transferase family protein n=1 Tax=Acer saccharum TaxID=4024 RepID=A0AA39SS77_ACESA|nr:hypothetical protein LWI29_009908 [Acer saccharum]KAK1588996.1 hypothetical protein Q3G72_029366 [Acer saccharum]